MTTDNHLSGMRVAILIANGFDTMDATLLREALIMAEADTELIAPAAGEIPSDATHGFVDAYTTRGVNDVSANDFAALVVPGGPAAIEVLSTDAATAVFIQGFLKDEKPIAAVNGGVLLLRRLGALNGRSVAAHPTLRKRVVEGGSAWVEGPVSVDAGLVTGHAKEGLVEFNNAMVAAFAAHHAGVGR